MEVKVTGNTSPSNCFDSISFLTNDGLNFGCDARSGTSLSVSNRLSPKVFSFPTGELAKITLMTLDACRTGCIKVEYKDLSLPACYAANALSG